MSQTVRAEYDAQTNSLRLSEPLEGVTDGQQLSVVVTPVNPRRPWSHLENVLKGEDGERFARTIAMCAASSIS